MSVWKKFTTDVLKNTNMGYLGEALKVMGLGLNTETKRVSNSWGSAAVDMALTRDNNILPIGFKNKVVGDDTVLELEGDFYGTYLREESFMDNLSQNYQAIRIKDQLENAGWSVETTQAGENLELVASQW